MESEIYVYPRSLLESTSITEFSYIRIDGATAAADRKASVDVFQTHDNVPVAILSITAANTGITLTAAKMVVFAELYWNPGVNS